MIAFYWKQKDSVQQPRGWARFGISTPSAGRKMPFSLPNDRKSSRNPYQMIANSTPDLKQPAQNRSILTI
jgi:hypothetical protein